VHVKRMIRSRNVQGKKPSESHYTGGNDQQKVYLENSPPSEWQWP